MEVLQIGPLFQTLDGYSGSSVSGLVSEYKEIIVALIAVLGGLIPYLYQRNKELKLRIASRKRHAYTAFLTNFTKTAVSIANGEEVTGKKADLERCLSRDRLLLFGSDEVIKAYDAWVRHSEQHEEEQFTDREGELVSLLLLAIRKDILGKTKLTKGDVENLNPYLRG